MDKGGRGVPRPHTGPICQVQITERPRLANRLEILKIYNSPSQSFSIISLTLSLTSFSGEGLSNSGIMRKPRGSTGYTSAELEGRVFYQRIGCTDQQHG